MRWLRGGRPWWLAALAVLGMTAQAGSQTEREAFVTDGAELLSQEQVADLFSGNSFRGEIWTAYYDESGRKATRIGDRVVERAWWVQDNGTVCQTLNRTGETACEPQFYQLGDVYRSFRDDGSLLVEFTMVPGNPAGL